MTKLLPFDLEAAKAGAKVVTRDGRPARIVCFDLKNEQSLLVVVHDNEGVESPETYYKNGKYSDRNTVWDLFLAPKPVKRWRVVYRGDDDNAAQRDFEDRADAMEFISDTGIDNATAPFIVEVTP